MFSNSLRAKELDTWDLQWHEAEDWYFSQVMRPDQFDVILYSGPDSLLAEPSTARLAISGWPK